MTENKKIAQLLFPDLTKTPADYEALYPARDLPQGARVTRIAPSPTGYLHLGTLFTALINRICADASGGIFFTRIEDTDKKREVEGGIEDIITGLRRFGIQIDEGFISGTEEIGAYGPYQQSRRAEIYQTYVKDLIEKGLAYPCFCTEEELGRVREEQEKQKVRTGYHGEWAVHRNITLPEVEEQLKAGKPFVIRLKSDGSEERRVVFDDLIKGRIEMPENDEDFVLLKSDGIPTYHFAHAIDDHLMHTTLVMRGDEWISSVPKHLQLFRMLGFKPVKYAHISPIMKLDNGAKRKISKRKDPEAAVRFFLDEGYDPQSVIEYLMTIAASDYEDWRKANPDADRKNFKFNPKKMSVSGALFDENKLLDVSRNLLSRMDADTLYKKLTDWASSHDPAFGEMLSADPAYTKAALSIDRGGKKPRKDLARFKEAKEYLSYFYDPLFRPCYDLPDSVSKEDAKAFLLRYQAVYDPRDDRQQWFEKIKALCPELGFAPETKAYKENPEAYKGHAGDLSTVLRIAVTGRKNTPDLCSIMQVLGQKTCLIRITAAVENL